MNKLCCLIIMILVWRNCTGQVLCIYCYDQNAPISIGVNNLVLNGGFENTTCISYPLYECFCSTSSCYSCDIFNWTCTGGVNTYAEVFDTAMVVIVEGDKAAYLGNDYCFACSPLFDDTSCFNNLFCAVTGFSVGYPHNTPGYGGSIGVNLEQTVNGLTIGNTYVLEFWAGGEYLSWPSMGVFAVDVGFGDTLMRNKPTPEITGIGTRYIIEFNATSSSHTIKFTNWGHTCTECSELVVDDVRLYTLTELSPSVPHCSLGTEDPASQSMTSVSPNPVINKLNVKTNIHELSEIILYDIASRKLLQQQFTNSISLSTEQLAKGIYFYEVRNKNGVIKKGKIVKD